MPVVGIDRSWANLMQLKIVKKSNLDRSKDMIHVLS